MGVEVCGELGWRCGAGWAGRLGPGRIGVCGGRGEHWVSSKSGVWCAWVGRLVWLGPVCHGYGLCVVEVDMVVGLVWWSVAWLGLTILGSVRYGWVWLVRCGCEGAVGMEWVVCG